MKSFEIRDGIVLFVNERKNDKQPVMRGTLTIANPLPPGEYEVALWGKVSKAGNKFWSGEFKPKQERRPVSTDYMGPMDRAQAEDREADKPDFDDEVPF